MQRARALLLDPTFDPPPAFVEELRSAAADFDHRNLDVGRYQTSEDIQFEELRPVLARCAPALLAQLERRKLAGYAERELDKVDASAWSAQEAILVVDSEAAAGCRSLRERITTETPMMNRSTPSELMIVELLDIAASEQINRILDADPDCIYQSLGEVLKPLTLSEIDTLVAQNRDGPERRIHNLIALLSIAHRGISDECWEWLEPLAFNPACDQRGSAFHILQEADPVRFGAYLLDVGWEWSSDESETCRRYGSLALIAAGADLPFERTAPAIAPLLLPRAVALRGGSAADALVAGMILDTVITADMPVPDPGSDITINTDRVELEPFAITLAPGRDEDEDDHPFRALARSLSPEGVEHTQRAITTALDRIRAARSAGANLYLQTIRPHDLAALVEHGSSLLTRWLEGVSDRSRDFCRRVRLSEGFYVALCEALLFAGHPDGSALWSALHEVMLTTYIGHGGVSQLTMMLFRAPVSPAIAALREQQLDLGVTNTDKGLLDLAIAAIRSGQVAWLDALIAEDLTSKSNWRRRRGQMLRGFGTGTELPVLGAWVEGNDSSVDEHREAAARRLSRDACARHWWRGFVQSDNAIDAYAHWVLFRHTADRRALAWLWSEQWPDEDRSDLERRKILQFDFNRQDLEKAAVKQEDSGENTLFDRKIMGDVSPWYRAE
jgi:hypothetical protein